MSLAAFALERSTVPAYVNVAVTGAFYFAFITALNTTLQAELHENVRGRVMALWMMGFGGTVGIGNLLVGPVVGPSGSPMCCSSALWSPCYWPGTPTCGRAGGPGAQGVVGVELAQ